jgi:hypothetical protein
MNIKKRGPGRPRLNKKDRKKSVTTTVSFTDETFKIVSRAAKIEGISEALFTSRAAVEMANIAISVDKK